MNNPEHSLPQKAGQYAIAGLESARCHAKGYLKA